MRFTVLCFVLIVFTVQAQSTPEPMVTLNFDAPISALAWSPDEQSLAIATGEIRDLTNPGQIYSYTIKNRTLTQLTDEVLTATSLVWRESDNAIFSSHLVDSNTRFFYGWDSQTGEQIAQAPDGGSVLSFSFNPGDERLAVSYGGMLMIYDAELTMTTEEATYETPSGNVIDAYVVLWMPDGEHLITLGHPDAPEFISAWIPGTGELTTIFEESDMLTSNGFGVQLALSPDGEWLAATMGAVLPWNYEVVVPDIFIWATADGTLQHRLERTGYGTLSIAWSPDSRLLAHVGYADGLAFWDIEHERIVAEWDTSAYRLAWSSENLLAVGSYGSQVMIFDMAQIEFE